MTSATLVTLAKGAEGVIGSLHDQSLHHLGQGCELLQRVKVRNLPKNSRKVDRFCGIPGGVEGDISGMAL